MSFANFSSMEEISLKDEDGTSVEFRVLMAYAQRRLSASKYSQLLEMVAKGREGSSLSRKEAQGVTPAEQGEAPQQKPPEAKRKSQKKKKKRRSNWRRYLMPSCLCGQTKDSWNSEVNGKLPDFQADMGSESLCFATEAQEDADIVRVADKLAELVDHSRSRSKRIGGKGLARTWSLEADGGGTSKIVPQGPCEDDGKDNEEKIIATIVTLLRRSGDELEKEMRKDKTLFSSFRDLMSSYSFFRRIANQFLEEVPVDPARDSEAHVQSTKVAYAMEVTTRLTAVDTHPMNLVLGYGTKYLKENFRPWVCSQGGWDKALGLLDQEEVE